MNEITTVGTLIEYGGKILTLLRSKEETYPETWGLAAGRLEEGEDPVKTAIREIQEETGYVAAGTDLEDLGVSTWTLPAYTVIFHTFRLRLQSPIEITLNQEEHTAYDWKTPEDILRLDNPILGLQELIKQHYFSEETEGNK